MNPRAWWPSMARVVGVTAGLWAALSALGVFVRIAPDWSPATCACALALAAELLVVLYRYESLHLPRRRARRGARTNH